MREPTCDKCDSTVDVKDCDNCFYGGEYCPDCMDSHYHNDYECQCFDYEDDDDRDSYWS